MNRINKNLLTKVYDILEERDRLKEWRTGRRATKGKNLIKKLKQCV